MKKFLFGTLFLLMLCIPMSVWAQTAIPYLEDFESMTVGSVPTGWSRDGSNTASIGGSHDNSVWCVANKDANKVLWMENYWTQDGIACVTSPSIIIPSTSSCQLTFKYANQANCGDLYVKISTDGGTTFADLGSYTPSGSVDRDHPLFIEETIDLASYSGDTVKIQFYANATYGSGAIFVDDVEVAPAPTCVRPVDLTVSNITATTADFSWTASGYGETSYQCLCIPADSTPDWTNVSAISSTMEFASDLLPNTNYKVYVRSYCSATDQSKVISASFKTACAAVDPASLANIGFEASEGFVSGYNNMTNCWIVGNRQSPANDTYIPYVYENTAYSTYSHAGSQCMFMRGAVSGTSTVADSAYAIMPDFIYNGSVASYEVHFYMRKYTNSNSYSDYNDTIFIGIISDPSDWSTFQVVGYAVNNTLNYTKCVVSLSGYQGTTGNIVFLAVANPYADPNKSRYGAFYVDDVQIVKGKATPTPTDVAVDNITMNTVDVSFTSTAVSNRILMATEAVADPEHYTNWAIDTVVSSNPATINVNSSTKYWLFVQGIGTVDSSFISNPAVLFESSCDVISTFPWTENFDNELAGVFDKVCWINEHISGTGTTLAKIKTSAKGDNTTGKLSFDYQASGTVTRVLTPEFNIPTADAYEFTLDVYRENRTNYLNDAVRVVVNNGAEKDTVVIPAVISVVGSVGAVPEEGWYNYVIALPNAGVQKIEILDISDNGYATYMDNFRVRKTPTCVKVMDVAVRDYQATQATIEWTMTAASKYQVLFTTAKVNPDTLATIPAAVIAFNDSTASAIDSMVVAGLNPATKYYVYVRGLCSDEIGEWSTVVGFRTECAALTITKTNIYTNGFEDEVSGSKDIVCWELNTTSTGDWPAAYNYGYYAHSGNMLLYFGGYAGSNDTSYYTMTEITNPVAALRLRFWMNGTNSVLSQNDSIYIGVMADINDKSSFVPVAGYQVDNSGYNQYEVCFDEYQGPEGRIAIKRVPVEGAGWIGSAYYGSAIDDITIDLAPTCKKVTGVEAIDVTKSSAILSWKATSASQYDFIIADQPINADDPDSAELTHIVLSGISVIDTVTVNALEPMTTYYAYVRGDCGDGDKGAFSLPCKFQTAAVCIIDNFTASMMGASYTSNIGVDSLLAGADNLIPDNSKWERNTYIAVDSASIKYNVYGSHNSAYYVLPAVDLRGVSESSLSFDVCRRSYCSAGEATSVSSNDSTVFHVMVSTDGLKTFTNLMTWRNDSIEGEPVGDYSMYYDITKYYQHVTIDISDYIGGNAQIVFGATCYLFGPDYDLHLDNIMVGTPATFTALSNDTALGTVTGSCTTLVGAKVPAIAYPNDGARFYRWSDGVKTNFNIYTVASENDTVVAYFLADSVDFVITSADTAMGVATGTGKYATLDTVTIAAIANTGFEFISWSDGDTNAVREIVAMEDLNLVASFDTLIVDYTIASSNENMGIVGYVFEQDTVAGGTLSGRTMYGTVFKVYAIPSEGYKFTGWSNGETADHFTLTVTSDTTITANFEALPPVAVEDVEASEYVAYTEGSRINVVGAEGHTVSVYDATGRIIAVVEKANRDEHFTVSVAGVYFIQVNGMKSTSVVVK